MHIESIGVQCCMVDTLKRRGIYKESPMEKKTSGLSLLPPPPPPLPLWEIKPFALDLSKVDPLSNQIEDRHRFMDFKLGLRRCPGSTHIAGIVEELKNPPKLKPVPPKSSEKVPLSSAFMKMLSDAKDRLRKKCEEVCQDNDSDN